jgi:ATP-dependent DNA ligase
VSFPRVLMPMEAKTAEEIPDGDGWQYEPKWDGFRCIALRNGSSVRLQSKSGQPLSRYFPELVETLLQLNSSCCALDGEVTVFVDGKVSFDDLLQRIHPAASRVARLAAEHPATFVVFDLLKDENGESLLQAPLSQRRPALDAFAQGFLKNSARIRLSPATTSLKDAHGWFSGVGGDLDGVIAKRLNMPYRAGERDGMVKVKHRRTADCVVGGFRYASKGGQVGSLLLGLFDQAGKLHHVGFTSSFVTRERAKLLSVLTPLMTNASFTGKIPGGPSRWSTKRSSEWQAVKPRLVVEVEFDHVSGDRFRHGTKFLRWRPDKAPFQCTLEQIAVSGKAALILLSGEGGRGVRRSVRKKRAKSPAPSRPLRRSSGPRAPSRTRPASA